MNAVNIDSDLLSSLTEQGNIKLKWVVSLQLLSLQS